MKVNVLGHKWKIRVYTDKNYAKKFAPRECGECDYFTRTISFRRTSFNEVSIVHELGHAYAHELSIAELHLTPDQTEEFMVELMAKYGRTIFAASDKIIERLGRTND